MSQQICTECGGKGKVTCPKCDGEGKIARTYWTPNGSDTCPTCRGVKVIPCRHCQGKGHVVLSDNAHQDDLS